MYTSKQWYTMKWFLHFSEKLAGQGNHICSVLEIIARIGDFLFVPLKSKNMINILQYQGNLMSN